MCRDVIVLKVYCNTINNFRSDLKVYLTIFMYIKVTLDKYKTSSYFTNVTFFLLLCYRCMAGMLPYG